MNRWGVAGNRRAWHIAHIGTVLNTTEDDMDRLYRINIKGVYNCMHVAVARMVEARR